MRATVWQRLTNARSAAPHSRPPHLIHARAAFSSADFDGAVLGGRPVPPADLGSGARAMELAVATPAAPQDDTPRRTCDVLLMISSAAGYERRRKTIRATYLQALRKSPALAARVSYRFLLGAPKPEQEAVLAAEQAEHGDLLQVRVPESYETLFPKIVASWRWAVATHDFGFWMHADDDAYIRLDLLMRWLDEAPAARPHAGLYAGYIWDGSEGRRTKPLRDPSAKSYMPIEQWPHDSYPPFASVRQAHCGHSRARPPGTHLARLDRRALLSAFGRAAGSSSRMT